MPRSRNKRKPVSQSGGARPPSNPTEPPGDAHQSPPDEKNPDTEKLQKARSDDNDFVKIGAAVNEWADYRAEAFVFNKWRPSVERTLKENAKDAITFFINNHTPRTSTGARKQSRNELERANASIDGNAPGDTLMRVKMARYLWAARDDK